MKLWETEIQDKCRHLIKIVTVTHPLRLSRLQIIQVVLLQFDTVVLM